MAEPLRILLAFVLAAAPSLLLCRVVMSMRIMDAPTEARKIQPRAVPTSGGVAVAISTALAVVSITELTDWNLDAVIMVTGAGAVAALLIGLADDILNLRAVVKLLLLVAAVVAVTAFGARADVLAPWPGAVVELPLALAIAGSMLWLIVVVNAVNFMDGANGLAMGMAAIAALGLSVCGAVAGAWSIALLAGALAGALAGFLVWNVPGKLFVGDAGAYFAGTVLGGLGLELVRVRPDLLFVPPMLLLPFLSDVLLTLAWRSKHGKKLFVAHRDHAYQIAMKANLKHWQVAMIHAVWAVNAAVLAVMSTMLGKQTPVIAFVLLLAVSTWVHWKVRRSGVQAGLVGADIA
jgi:UDP-N-acetylmuramyl pentapeptide phosphotransferase/UDP-N-acetylglucosamine-1-phosphate transferase